MHANELVRVRHGGVEGSEGTVTSRTTPISSTTTIVPTAPGSCERLIYIDELVRGDNHTTTQLAHRLHASHRGLVESLRRNLRPSPRASPASTTCDDDPRMARGAFESPTYRSSRGARFPTGTGFPSTVEDGIQVRMRGTSARRHVGRRLPSTLNQKPPPPNTCTHMTNEYIGNQIPPHRHLTIPFYTVL